MTNFLQSMANKRQILTFGSKNVTIKENVRLRIREKSLFEQVMNKRTTKKTKVMLL